MSEQNAKKKIVFMKSFRLLLLNPWVSFFKYCVLSSLRRELYDGIFFKLVLSVLQGKDYNLIATHTKIQTLMLFLARKAPVHVGY